MKIEKKKTSVLLVTYGCQMVTLPENDDKNS